MAYTHQVSTRAETPEGVVQDTATTYTGDTTTAVATTVDANGGSANAVAIAFLAAGLQHMLLLATVPCVVTLTGCTVINGVTASTVTLAANVMTRVTSVTGNCTAISVGANTTGAGAAGTITIAVLHNS